MAMPSDRISEMIEAVAHELLSHDPDYDSVESAARRVLLAAFGGEMPHYVGTVIFDDDEHGARSKSAHFYAAYHAPRGTLSLSQRFVPDIYDAAAVRREDAGLHEHISLLEGKIDRLLPNA